MMNLEKHIHLIIKIWGDVLNISEKEIEHNDDFFELGGDSKKLIQVIARIEDEFGIYFTDSQIYENRTVLSQAKISIELEKIYRN